MAVIADPALRPVVEDLFGRPFEEEVEVWAELWPFQFELAEEARALCVRSASRQLWDRSQPLARSKR